MLIPYENKRGKKMKSKKAIAEFVAYVLLIGLSIALSVVVYSWLRGYANPANFKTCPDGVSLIVEDYTCDGTNLKVNLTNKGLFKIDGYIFRINNETDISGDPVGLPVNLLEMVTLTTPLNPGETTPRSWPYKAKYGRVVEMEVEPFRLDGAKKILCDKAILRQRTTLVECN